MDEKKEKVKKIARIFYLLVPLISATISAFHVESFLRLGNPTFLSVSTAVAYEVANIGAMVIFVLVPRVKMNFIWAAFLILVFMQIMGNIYFSYDWIQNKIDADPEYVTNFVKMIRSLTDFMELETVIFMLACLIGAPVPIVALLLTKGTSEYLVDAKEEDDDPKGDEPIKASPLHSEIEEKPSVAEKISEAKEDISPVIEEASVDVDESGKKDESDEKGSGDPSGSGIVVDY